MDRYLIDLGFLQITWYAFFIVLALTLGFILVMRNKNIDFLKKDDLIYDYFFYLIIISFLGARLWYVIFNFQYYSNHLSEIIKIWYGGLAIHGALLAGIIYTAYFVRKHDFNFFKITDAIVPALLLGQAIGRIGNFVNQEAHGPETTRDFLANTLHLPNFIVEGMNINGVYYQPTFLYESIFNLIGFFLIILLLSKIWKNKIGYITAFYLIWYGFIRSIIEQFRTDALYLGPIRIAQLTSVLMVIIGIILFIYLKKYNDRKTNNL